MTVEVELGLMRISAPKPSPTPTTPTAASAPTHFKAPRLETLFASSFASDKIFFSLENIAKRGLVYTL